MYPAIALLWVYPAIGAAMSPRRGTALESVASHESVVVGSHRVFGWVMAAFAALLTLWAWRNGKSWLWWPAGTSFGLALIASARPALLAPLNRLWMALGHMLGRIVSPIVMSLIYFGVVTPIG